MKIRPEWDTYFAQITRVVATRSTCLRASHGAVIVKDKRILATGYNGAPSTFAHCTEMEECYRTKMGIPSGERYEKCRALHAEQNSILQCAKFGIPIQGSTLYVTDVPCELCAKQILASGIIEVVMLRESGRYCSEALYAFQQAGFVVRDLKEN